MDLITQMQNYVGYLSLFMANSLDHLHTQAPPIAPPHSSPSSPPTTTSTITTASSTLLPTPARSFSSASAVSLAESAVSPSFPPPPQLDLVFSSVLDEKAFQLVKRVHELQRLIACLPAHIDSEEEQLERLRDLQRLNEEEEGKLRAAREEAELWQRRVAHVLQRTAVEQLRIATQTKAKDELLHNNAAHPPPSAQRKRGIRRKAATQQRQRSRIPRIPQSSSDAMTDT